MNRLKTRLLVTAAALAVFGTSAQAAELVQKDDAPVTRTDSLAGLSVDSSSEDTTETAAEASTEAGRSQNEPWKFPGNKPALNVLSFPLLSFLSSV